MIGEHSLVAFKTMTNARGYPLTGVVIDCDECTQMTYTFHASFGAGQPNYPGFLEVTVKADCYTDAYAAAYERMNKATDLKWCCLYDSLDLMHPDDLVFRGKA